MERKEYTLTQEQYDKVLDACKPVSIMYLSGGIPMGGSQQDNANSAWTSLGNELGFQGMSVESTDNKLVVTALPA